MVAWVYGCGWKMEEVGGMEVWEVIVVEMVEVDGMVWKMERMELVVVEDDLLLLGSKRGSIIIPFCEEIVDMDTKFSIGAFQKFSIWDLFCTWDGLV